LKKKCDDTQTDIKTSVTDMISLCYKPALIISVTDVFISVCKKNIVNAVKTQINRLLF